MSESELTSKSKSHRSKEYKEECRNLLEKVVALQLKVYKAPDLYVQEVLKVIEEFKKQYEDVKLNPGANNQKFIIISQFLSKVAIFYKSDMVFFVEDLMELIDNYQNTLHQNLRMKIIFHLLRVRGKGMIEPFRMIKFLMKLFNTQDKDLRRIVHRFIVKDIQKCNKKGKNDVLNKQIQNFIIDLLKKSTANISKRAIQILIELYRKNVWKDNKVINIIAQGCLNQNYKIKLLACYFLIETTETKIIDESDSSDDENQYIQKKGKNKSVKPTKAREHRLQREKKTAAKKQRKKLKKLNAQGGFFPLDVIYSPQDFSERLFQCLKKNEGERFTVKLAMMHLLSRLIYRHKLILIPFYSYIQKFLYPNGKEIGKLLSYLAEAIHDNIPRDDLDSTIKHLIDQFISDRCSDQTLTMGIKTIFQIVQKYPAVLDKFNINYVAHYTKFKNRNVSQSARAVMNFYRNFNPQLLDRKFRGKQWKSLEELEGVNDIQFENVAQGIDGADLLQEEEENKQNKKYDIPIYYDRLLTDEDFKRMRALKRKLEAEQEAQRLQQKKFNQNSDNEDEDEDYYEDIEEDNEEEEGQNDNASDVSAISDDWEDEDEDEEDDDEDDEDDEEKQIKKTKENNKKRRQSISELEDSVQEFYSSGEEIVDENPHGFINEEAILQYKKTKAEQKVFQQEQEKEKWYQGPKQKKSEFASKTNKEKLKMKPLAMVRAKKVQEKSKEKNLKDKIKSLKNQLGHVRSGKQAKKLKKVKMG